MPIKRILKKSSNMENKVLNNSPNYIFEFDKKSNSCIFLGIAALVWLYIFCAITYNLIHWYFSVDDFPLNIADSIVVLVFLLFLLGFGLFIIDHFLWQIRGREIIIISNNLKIKKIGKVFKISSTIELSSIESISYDEENFITKYFTEPFFKNGVIKIKTKQGYYRIGQDISKQLAQKAAREMNEKINFCSA